MENFAEVRKQLTKALMKDDFENAFRIATANKQNASDKFCCKHPSQRIDDFFAL